MIIDAHQHAFWHGRDDAGLVQDMDQNGIDVAWLLTWEIAREEWKDLGIETSAIYSRVLNSCHRRADGSHAGIVLSDLIRAKEHYPNRFVLGYCPNPSIGDAADLFEAAVKMWGVRVCGEWKCRMLLDDPRCVKLFRKAGEFKCPVVIHLQPPFLKDAETGKDVYQPEWYGGTVENLARAAQACPDTVILGHGPGFWREIGDDADESPSMVPVGPFKQPGRLEKIMAENPNIWADMSAGSGRVSLTRDLDYSRLFFKRFADRIVFARDYYGGDHQAALKKLALPKDIEDKVMFANAQRLVPVNGK